MEREMNFKKLNERIKRKRSRRETGAKQFKPHRKRGVLIS